MGPAGLTLIPVNPVNPVQPNVGPGGQQQYIGPGGETPGNRRGM
jgi:hypothetical protein